MRIEPAPSEPIAAGTTPAATAAAAPPLEPPGVWSVFQGLRVAPCRGVSVKCHWPTSGAWVLPITIAPASRRRRTASASRAAGRPPPQPNGVVWPVRSTSSLIATGHPEQRAAVAGGDPAVGLLGLGQRFLGADDAEGVQGLLRRPCPLQRRGHQLDGGGLAGSGQSRLLRQSGRRRFGYPAHSR